MSDPTGPDIAQALRDAFDEVRKPPRLKAVCECGATMVFQNHGLLFPGQPNGVYCERGHRLPGQDMPSDYLT